jgi:glycosyltransferase involved in cell wall biosynthesis
VRIGINSLYLIPGGVGGTESYLRNLVRKLQETDRENEYFIYTNEENAGSFSLSATNFHEVRCPLRATSRPRRILWEQLVLPLQAARDRLDVLHSPGYTAPLMLRCAGVVTIHDMNYHYFPEDWPKPALWANRLLIPRVARRSTRILTDSQCSRRAIAEVLGITDDKIEVVYLGVDGNLAAEGGAADEQPARAKHRLDGPYLLSVTASHPHKNLDGLLRAYEIACRAWDAPPPLVIVGIKGLHQERVERMLAERRSAGRVIFTGWVADRELAALYRAAHLFVFPSKYEGFGFPVLEAMSAGVPVVSSNATSLPELVGDAGVLVDPNDADALAAAIRRAWSDEALRRDLIARGRGRVAEFTWQRAAEQTLATYREAARLRREGR